MEECPTTVLDDDDDDDDDDEHDCKILRCKNEFSYAYPTIRPSIHPSIPYMHMHRHFNCLSNYPIANYTIYIYIHIKHTQ